MRRLTKDSAFENTIRLLIRDTVQRCKGLEVIETFLWPMNLYSERDIVEANKNDHSQQMGEDVNAVAIKMLYLATVVATPIQNHTKVIGYEYRMILTDLGAVPSDDTELHPILSI